MKRFNVKQKQKSGFTMIEFIICLTIASILMAIGIPIFRTTTANNKVKVAARELSADLELAKSFAMAGWSTPNKQVVIEITGPVANATGYRIYTWDKSSDEKINRKIVNHTKGQTIKFPETQIQFNANGTININGILEVNGPGASRIFKVYLYKDSGAIKVKDEPKT